MANPAWTPVTVITQYQTVIIDPSNNVQQATKTGVTGATLPLFASAIGAITPDGTAEWTCVGTLTGASLPKELVGLPAPLFVNDADGLDPQLILTDMVETFEALTDRPLYPAQLERLLVNLYAFREALVRNIVQYAGQQCLLAFADFPNIDYLAQLLGVERLVASGALTTMRFTLDHAVGQPHTVAAGTLVATRDGAVQFATQRDLVVPAGQVDGLVAAVATTAGLVGNGYAPGEVSTLVTPDALVSAVVNTTTTADGAPLETTDSLRLRAQQAPNRFSVAGPTEAYAFFARSVGPEVTDVDVETPSPGQVTIAILGTVSAQPARPGTQGAVSQSLIDAVAASVSATTVRPICDTVTVSAAVEVDYSVDAVVTLRAGADVTAVETALATTGSAFALRLARSLKSDVVPEEWIAVLGSIGGVYRVQMAAPPYRQLSSNEWANCTSIALTLLDIDGLLLGQVSV